MKQQEGREANLASKRTLSIWRAIDIPHMRQPVELLRRDHLQQRLFCKKIGALVDDLHQPRNQKLALSLRGFLTVNLSRCREDWEELVAPALMRRCREEDDAEAVLRELRRRHHSESAAAARIVDGLNDLVVGSVPPTPLEFIVSGLQIVEILENNIDWENAVLLPLAALRLNKDDQDSLAFLMVMRRSLKEMTMS